MMSFVFCSASAKEKHTAVQKKLIDSYNKYSIKNKFYHADPDWINEKSSTNKWTKNTDEVQKAFEHLDENGRIQSHYMDVAKRLDPLHPDYKKLIGLIQKEAKKLDDNRFLQKTIMDNLVYLLESKPVGSYDAALLKSELEKAGFSFTEERGGQSFFCNGLNQLALAAEQCDRLDDPNESMMILVLKQNFKEALFSKVFLGDTKISEIKCSGVPVKQYVRDILVYEKEKPVDLNKSNCQGLLPEEITNAWMGEVIDDKKKEQVPESEVIDQNFEFKMTKSSYVLHYNNAKIHANYEGGDNCNLVSDERRLGSALKQVSQLSKKWDGRPIKLSRNGVDIDKCTENIEFVLAPGSSEFDGELFEKTKFKVLERPIDTVRSANQ